MKEEKYEARNSKFETSLRVKRSNLLMTMVAASFLMLLGLFYYQEVFAACEPGTSFPRADLLVSSPTLSGKFYSQGGVCIVNVSPQLISFDIANLPTYDKMKTKYYTNSTSPKVEIVGTSLNITNETIYHSSDDLTIRSVSGAGVAIVFVDKNLEIAQDILYGKGNDSYGLVFIVKGDVFINANVTEINAIIITEGRILTAAPLGGICNPTALSPSLVVNGSVISINSSSAINFCRRKADTRTPSEIINHQTKYLIIFKDILSETQQKWSEISEIPPLNVVPFSAAPSITFLVDGSAGPITKDHNSTITLSWTTTNSPTSCIGTWGTNPKPPASSETVGPLTGPNTYTYTLTCANASGTNNASVTVYIKPPPPTVTLKADGSELPITVNHRQSVTLSWNVTNSPTSCTGDWGSNPKVIPSGSETVGPLLGPNTYTYTLTCTNAAGSGSDFVEVSVNPPPIPPPPTNLTASCPNPGTSATLDWDDSLDATLYLLRVNNQSDAWDGSCTSLGGDFCQNVTSSTHTFSSISGAVYGWWVHACNGSGCSAPTLATDFSCWSPPVYVDNDGDLYGSGAALATCPVGKTCRTVGGDCYDVSGGSTTSCDGGTHTLSYCAHPGQTSYFTTNRGDGSFDYDCDGSPLKEYTYYSGLSLGNPCKFPNLSCTGTCTPVSNLKSGASPTTTCGTTLPSSIWCSSSVDTSGGSYDDGVSCSAICTPSSPCFTGGTGCSNAIVRCK